ncbi:cytochrome P450 [Synechococcus sp. KORDI-52]|uniref:cytochrome P450 n=1 Tax=Synechococcus sp. KORDI-52 TaxID=585425 RepID=UPI0004E06CA5|nr:cytochrome P450 [Synechococcus sp. KORDI-52]AII49204.1 cytochrome P450 [Synechococcus sp. KORDI-52]
MTTSTLPSTGAVTGLGETLAFFTRADFAQQRFKTYGDVFETKLLGQRMVFIQGEQAISDLFRQSDVLEGWWPESVKQLLGSKSLANRTGPGHKARRRVVGQLFSSAALARYRPSIEGLVDELILELVTSDAALPLAPRMRRFAFSVIATTVLGLDGASRDALFNDFEVWTKALFSVPLAIPGTPFARAMAARQRLLERIKTELQRADKAGGLDLLSGGLDEAGIPLDDDDLAEQLLLLLFAGYETTASSLSCLFRALLLHPEVETWVREGLAESTTSERLDATVLEVMRLTPPVGGFYRRCLEPISLADVALPQGSVVQVVLRSAAPEDDADLAAFRPQRHLDGTFGQTLLPFGGGERVCLGKALAELEIRLMATGLLQSVELQLEPEQDLGLQRLPSPTPKDGLLVQATAR